MDKDALALARRDVEYAGLLIRYHGAYGRHLTNAITDNQVFIIIIIIFLVYHFYVVILNTFVSEPFLFEK